MKEYIFAIDCDEVLRPTLDGMIKIFNREFPDYAKTRKDITDFDVEISFPEVRTLTGMPVAEWFFQDDEHSKELFVDAKPFETAVEDIKTLQKYGKVIIVTHQHGFKNKSQTLEWLYKNGFEPDGVCFLKNKEIIDCDYFLDDNPKNFNGSKCKCAILIEAPYNEKTSIFDLNTEAKTRAKFKSLHEFAESFYLTHNKNNKD